MKLSLAAKSMETLKMRHNLTITILAVLLLFQNQICLGRRIDDPAEDNSNVPDEGHADPEDEINSYLFTDNDDDPSESGTASRDVPRFRRDVHAGDVSIGHGGLQDSRTHEDLNSGDPLSESESRASATGLSVGNGWALGYGKASITGGGNGGGYVNGRRQGPEVETAEEFGLKSGKDVAIARVGGGGRAEEGGSPSGGGYPGGINPVERGIFDSGSGHERGPARPATGAVDDRGTYGNGHGNERAPIRPATGVADDRGTYGNGHGNERAPLRPATGVAGDRGTYGNGYGNERAPIRPATGVAGDRGTYGNGYGNERGPKPPTGQGGTDRRVVDNRYPDAGVTGVRIPPTVDRDGNIVYSYNTDGRPTRVTFTDRNGGKGVINHFFEKKNLNNGLSGDRKVTGTSFSSGFSLAYGGGNFGNGGAGNGNSGAVAYGNGIRIPGGAHGTGIGDGTISAYGSGIGQGGTVAFGSGSGFVSGTGISIGDAYVGPRNGRNGARSTGISVRQGTVMGNGKGYSGAVIYA